MPLHPCPPRPFSGPSVALNNQQSSDETGGLYAQQYTALTRRLTRVRGGRRNRVIGSVRLLHEPHSRKRPTGHDRPIHPLVHTGHILRNVQPTDGQRVRRRRQRRPRERIRSHRRRSPTRAIPRHDQSGRTAAESCATVAADRAARSALGLRQPAGDGERIHQLGSDPSHHRR
jgi:hypothetical protein